MASDDTQRPTPFQQGNTALRSGHYAAAIRYYALGLADEPSHRNGPIAGQLAAKSGACAGALSSPGA